MTKRLPAKRYEIQCTAIFRAVGPAAKLGSEQMVRRLIAEAELTTLTARMIGNNLVIMLCPGDNSSPSRIDLVIPLVLKEASEARLSELNIPADPIKSSDSSNPETRNVGSRQVITSHKEITRWRRASQISK